ncbi:AAA family ATPase [Maritimibacter dapengensis]|uniref:AAA family ATPase n=1 Tax=Maritimibacter dapengensis TaxID=2836868 RepID=A0ABS6T7A3_9RHOB|nr:ATP-binding protein [Maritimibacter dapengensis]MBV7380356.1 AAA family ATPase [Maritimibacter dapengensis]
MLRNITFRNWKSFRESKLHFDQLTILIGTNASGKSNALDALEFLSRIANSTDIMTALAGDGVLAGIRGQDNWASYRNGKSFSLSVLIGTDDEKTDYQYSITVVINDGVAELSGEELSRIKYQGSNPRTLRLFWTDPPEPGAPGIIARLYNTKSGTKRPLRRNLSALSQLEIDPDIRSEIVEGIRFVARDLRQIFILDPKPNEMRDFTRLSENLKKDGSNIAGVLMALKPEDRNEIQNRLTKLAAKIPEKDISKVWAEYVGRHKADAMLYCSEAWTPGEEFEVDARGMSDGTLRFIAVIGALLLRPRRSLIVVEEIDNGLHPSRSLLLLDAINKLAKEREIDLLITTHNVALLDSLPPRLVRSISVATRTDDEGASIITSLDDIPLLARMIAEGEVGKLAKEGRIEQTIRMLPNG